MRIHVMFSIFLFFLFSCNKDNGSSSNALDQASCSMNGVWTQCQTDGTDSQRITLDIEGEDVMQDIETYNGVTDCSGVPGGAFNFEISLVQGPRAQSEFIPEGTDLDITPPVGQDFGCGVDTEFFNTMKFFDNCNSFKTSENGCDPNNRETTLLSNPFSRE